MLVKLFAAFFISFVLAEADDFTASGPKPRNITQVQNGYSKVIFQSSAQDSSIWFSFGYMYGFPSVRVNSTVTTKNATKVADFRLLPVRITEYNSTISVDQSKNSFEFQNKQHLWSEITVEKFNEVIDKKDTTIVRMNATLTEGSFKYTINIYLTDRSCFYGNYNLDVDAAYIVQNIQGFNYKYEQSSVAIEQVVASRNSGQISSFLAFLESPFLGSLVINHEAYDTKLGKLPVTVSDFDSIEFTTVTSDLARESDYERVYVGVGSTQQPSDVFVEERFSVNLGLVKKDGFESGGINNGNTTQPGSNTEGGEMSAAGNVCPSFILAAVFALMMVFW